MTHLLHSDHLAVATNLKEALAWRQGHPQARVIGGGTELMADQALELFRPAGYLHVGRIDALQAVVMGDDTIVIGAGLTIERLGRGALAQALPILAQLAQTIGTPQARRSGTVGGNLGSGMPDRSLAPALLALGCCVTLHSAERGERSLPLPAFLLGRGRTALAADELITAVAVQRRTVFSATPRWGHGRHWCIPPCQRPWWWIHQSRWLALGIGNAADTAIRVEQAERQVVAQINWNQRSLPAGLAEQFGQWAAEACTPCSDEQASAAYRRHAVAVMSRACWKRPSPPEYRATRIAMTASSPRPHPPLQTSGSATP